MVSGFFGDKVVTPSHCIPLGRFSAAWASRGLRQVHPPIIRVSGDPKAVSGHLPVQGRKQEILPEQTPVRLPLRIERRPVFSIDASAPRLRSTLSQAISKFFHCTGQF